MSSEDTHDKLMRAFQEYFKNHDKFEYENSDVSGIRARYWLSEIRTAASARRMEIQSKRKEKRLARKGRPGRPPKIHK